MPLKLNFVRQQGFQDASAESCAYQYPALMWQPRVIGILVVIGVIVQNWTYFLVLGAILWWSAALPALNPFDALYNWFVARRKQVPRTGPAPSPRRLAQTIAGAFMLGIGLSLWFGQDIVAWALEAFLLAALAALIFGGFCLGSYLYWVFTRQAKFAHRTLPWSRAE